MRTKVLFTICTMILVMASFSGCNKGPSPTDPAPGTGGVNSDSQESAHSHEALHGGQIIELGEEEYHAELTHDDATHTVGIYMLDGTATEAAPIVAQSVTVNCIVDGTPVQFALLAVPQTDDPAGRSSYFELVSEKLCDGWDADGAGARLNVTIDDRPYVGQIEAGLHDHDHDEDHAHAHDDKSGHDDDEDHAHAHDDESGHDDDEDHAHAHDDESGHDEDDDEDHAHDDESGHDDDEDHAHAHDDEPAHDHDESEHDHDESHEADHDHDDK